MAVVIEQDYRRGVMRIVLEEGARERWRLLVAKGVVYAVLDRERRVVALEVQLEWPLEA